MKIPRRPNSENLTIGQHIKVLRHEYLHQTQSELAKRLAINQVTVANYERDHQRPKMSILRGLAEIADEHNYLEGYTAFHQAAGGRSGPMASKGILLPESKLEEIMDRLVSAKQALGSLPDDPNELDQEFFNSQVYSAGGDLNWVIKELRKLIIRGDAK